MPGGWMGIVVILCAGMGLFSRSADGASGSHIQPVERDAAWRIEGMESVDPVPTLNGEALAPPLGPPAAPDAPHGALHWAADLIAVGMALLAPLVLVVLWRMDVIRPGSLARRGVREVRQWPWWFWLLCAFGLLVGTSVGAGLAGGMAAAMLVDPADLTIKAFQSVGGGVVGVSGGVLLVLLLREPSGVPMARPNPAASGLVLWGGWGDVSRGALAFALTMPLVQATTIVAVSIYMRVMQQAPDAIAHETLQAVQAEPGRAAAWAVVLGAVVATPIVEELLFRVFLQSALLRLFGPRRVWLAIGGTSAIFALAHVGPIALGQWHALVSLFVLSMAMGYAYEWTRRPVAPIVIHMGFNAFNIAMVLMAP
jgi:uncharacterized protein